MSSFRPAPFPPARSTVAAGSAAAAFFLALLLLLPGIGTGYWGRDEAEYAGVAHGMNATGDYLVPRLFGRLYPDKPPLSEWLTAASFRVFGEREASGRLPHVLLGESEEPLCFPAAAQTRSGAGGSRYVLACSVRTMLAVSCRGSEIL